MYDFYKNPPKTKQDLRDYFTTWLEKIDDHAALIVNGETFVQEFGFRRGFYTHGAFCSLLTHEYVWWVFEVPDLKTFPTIRFPTYDALLEYVIDDYYTKWKLDK